MKDPLRVTYNDLIADAEWELKRMKKTFPGLVISGRMSAWSATHLIEKEKTKVKIFKALKEMNAKFISKDMALTQG